MKTTKKPSVPVAYVDEMNFIDNRARAIIELCRGCCDPERLDPFVVSEIGNLFDDLLDRRQVVEHFFLGVQLRDNIEDARVGAELHYLKARHADAGREVG